MRREEITWVRYMWDLRHSDVNVGEPTGYVFRSTRAGELETVLSVVLSAYGTDPAWKPILAAIEARMTDRIRSTFGTRDSDYVAAEFDGRLVAVSGIAREHWTDQNLLTGICVLPSHQRRGLGKYLLGTSLLRLREMGLRQARVYTESGSLADRKVYPLFNSVREENVVYPGLLSPNNGGTPMF